MFDASIIKKTGQAWKLVIFLGGSFGGAIVIWIARQRLGADAGAALVMLLGVAIGLSSFAFGLFAIRCPKCRARWLWQGVSKQAHSRWFAAVMSQSAWPSCSFTI